MYDLSLSAFAKDCFESISVERFLVLRPTTLSCFLEILIKAV